MCAVTSIVDRSVRSIESIDGRYGGCWRRSSPKPPSHKPRRRLNSSSTPGPVDCARAVWRETLSWVPFGAAPPQVTRLTVPDNPLQTAPFLIARYDDARAKPTHARALRRRRRSLARSIARTRCGVGDGDGGGGGGGGRLHRAPRAMYVTHTHARVITAHGARHQRFPSPRAIGTHRVPVAMALAVARRPVSCGRLRPRAFARRLRCLAFQAPPGAGKGGPRPAFP